MDHIVDANKMATPRTDAAYAASTGAGIYELFKESQDLERELTAANSEIARLKAGGCARDQRTTQFCAEAAEMARKLEEANKRIAELEQWIRELQINDGPNAFKHRRRMGGEIGWLYPGQCAYIGSEKPEGLR